MSTSLLCGYKPHFKSYFHICKVQNHLKDEIACIKWIGKILNVAAILMYNIFEINYFVMLVFMRIDLPYN